jgi:hypothetical protein
VAVGNEGAVGGSGSSGAGAGSPGGCSEEGLGRNGGAARELAALLADSVVWWPGCDDAIVGCGDSLGRKQLPWLKQVSTVLQTDTGMISGIDAFLV